MKVYLSKKRIYLSIFLFFAIFCPPIIKDVNLLFFATAYSVVALLFNYRKDINDFIHQKNIFIFNLSFLVMIIYIFIRMIYDYILGNNLEILGYVRHLYKICGAFFFIQPIAVYVVLYCKRHLIDYKGLLKVIIMAGLIEACFTILMLISPDIRMDLLEVYFKNVYDADLTYYASWVYNERFYGFANVLVDIFGFATGIICGLSWFYFIKYDIRYILLFCVLCIVPVTNSVSGVVMAALGVFVFFMAQMKRGKISKRAVGSIGFILIIAFIGFTFLYENAAGSIERLLNNIYALLGNYDDITSFKILFSNEFWTFPSGRMNLLFGTGHAVFSTGSDIHSDVGYINNIWLIGITGSIIFYGIFIRLFYAAYRKSNSEIKKMTIAYVLICFFVFEIKGITVSINPGILIIFMLVYACLFDIDHHELGKSNMK